MSATTYRPDIDGLRGLAMFPILFLHAGLPLTPGGFISVDIFFVISGYLIIDIVRNQLAAGKFSLFDFMSRRVRRIFPAAFVTVFFTLLAGWFLLEPYDYQQLAVSARYNMLFSANFFFWMQAGYWDTASHLKPLLHTWSLAVEEQFYLLLPLFMVATFRFRENIRLLLMLLIALASFIASEWSVQHAPSSAYYLLHSRAWEILIGGLLTYVPRNNGNKPWLSELVGGAGLLTILALYYLYDHYMPFPGINGLAPTLATAALIWGGPNNLGSRFLSTRIMVYFGRMTYSWYLVHWPLIAFANYWYFNEPPLPLIIFLLVASFVLAHLSRRYVEEPLLKKKIFKTNKTLLPTAICLMLTTVTVAQIINIHKGFPGRPILGDNTEFSKEKQTFANYFDNTAPSWHYNKTVDMDAEYRHDCNFYVLKKYHDNTPNPFPHNEIDKNCYTRDVSIPHALFIWGDSHAQQLYSGLKSTLPSSWQILQVASSGCPPKLGATASESNYCEQSNWFAMKSIKETRPDVVIVAQGDKHNIEKMQAISHTLKQAGVGKVIFTGPTPHWATDLPKIIMRKLWKNTPQRTAFGLDAQNLHANKLLAKQLANRPDIDFFNIIDVFCNHDGCLTYLGNDRMTGITTNDYGHLTPIASRYLAEHGLANSVLEGRK